MKSFESDKYKQKIEEEKERDIAAAANEDLEFPVVKNRYNYVPATLVNLLRDKDEEDDTNRKVATFMDEAFLMNPFKTSKKIYDENGCEISRDKEAGMDNKERFDDEKEAANDDIRDEMLTIFFREKTPLDTELVIERSDEIRQMREKLPIFMRESDVLDSVNNNLITIVCGETGSGKSTQLPQFLLENSYSNKNGPNPGKIGVTQPRRIAAISLAKRVSEELGSKLGQLVGYQVRYEQQQLSELNRIKVIDLLMAL
jgi:HrpA-like RNA helicase